MRSESHGELEGIPSIHSLHPLRSQSLHKPVDGEWKTEGGTVSPFLRADLPMTSRRRIPATVRWRVAEQAGHRCSYCRSPEVVGIPILPLQSATFRFPSTTRSIGGRA